MGIANDQSTRKVALLERLSLIEDSAVLEDVERVLDEFGASQLQPLEDADLRAIVEELLGPR